MRLWNACDRAALRRADAVVCVSSAWETHLAAAGVSADRLHVAGNTTAILPPGPLPPAIELPPGRHLLFAGRSSPEKGIDWLLAVWPDLRRRFPDLHLWIAGDGVRSGDLVERPVGIHPLGFQTDIRPWLLAVDAVIAPSRREAWGMTVFEALALGVPVLAARTGGLPHLCAQAPHARLFTPLSLPALGDGLQTILAPDFPRGPDLGLAYRSQPRFDPARRSEHWLALYQRLLRPSP
jgi:glycosyltransferase involved in cell wall biosynthesis